MPETNDYVRNPADPSGPMITREHAAQIGASMINAASELAKGKPSQEFNPRAVDTTREMIDSVHTATPHVQTTTSTTTQPEMTTTTSIPPSTTSNTQMTIPASTLIDSAPYQRTFNNDLDPNNDTNDLAMPPESLQVPENDRWVPPTTTIEPPTTTIEPPTTTIEPPTTIQGF